MRLLVVAGEPSGDRALAAVLQALARHRSFDSFGFGGEALSQMGTRLVAHVRDVSGLGLFELAGRAPTIARALMRLSSAVRETPPDVALLASWSAGNARIGARLRAMRVPVVWISPPEVWAWREGRAARLARAADRFAVTLPFEEALWRAAGADATYAGHPALDRADDEPRDRLRARLGIPTDARAVAILPGSRPAEIARLVEPFARAMPLAFAQLPDVTARIVVAPSLPEATRELLRATATSAGIATIDAPPEGALSYLPAFDAALVASGTASLECALAGVPPVVAYRLHPLTMAIARRVVRTPHIALPNVVLSRAGHAPAFRELVQEAVTPEALATALHDTLLDPAARAGCDAVRAAMNAPLSDGRRFDERVAAIVLAASIRA
jgi:lipid-A-disaccharide synthase